MIIEDPLFMEYGRKKNCRKGKLFHFIRKGNRNYSTDMYTRSCCSNCFPIN
jgi:hypothetical protein